VKYQGAAKPNCEICHKIEVSADRLIYCASINHKLTKITMNNHGLFDLNLRREKLSFQPNQPGVRFFSVTIKFLAEKNSLKQDFFFA